METGVSCETLVRPSYDGLVEMGKGIVTKWRSLPLLIELLKYLQIILKASKKGAFIFLVAVSGESAKECLFGNILSK